MGIGDFLENAANKAKEAVGGAADRAASASPQLLEQLRSMAPSARRQAVDAWKKSHPNDPLPEGVEALLSGKT